MFSEPAPVVMKKLLVADAGWHDLGGASVYGQQIGQAIRAYPAPRDATFEDIAKALNVDAEALAAWVLQNPKAAP